MTKLKTAIIDSGVSQKSIAQRTGINYYRLNRLVNGYGKSVRAEEKRAISKLLYRRQREIFE